MTKKALKKKEEEEGQKKKISIGGGISKITKFIKNIL